MSGIPQFNYPAFHEAAKCLRAEGYEVISPAELDDDETVKQAMQSKTGKAGTGTVNGETWGDFLMRDVKIVADLADGVILLPNWETSRGARLEAFVAINCEKPLFEYIFGHAHPLPAVQAMKDIHAETLDQTDSEKYEVEIA